MNLKESLRKERSAVLAYRCRRLREEAGLSRSQLAAEIGADESSVGAIERGVRDPGIWMLTAMCRVLGSTPNRMLTKPAAAELSEIEEILKKRKG